MGCAQLPGGGNYFLKSLRGVCGERAFESQASHHEVNRRHHKKYEKCDTENYGELARARRAHRISFYMQEIRNRCGCALVFRVRFFFFHRTLFQKHFLQRKNFIFYLIARRNNIPENHLVFTLTQRDSVQNQFPCAKRMCALRS